MTVKYPAEEAKRQGIKPNQVFTPENLPKGIPEMDMNRLRGMGLAPSREVPTVRSGRDYLEERGITIGGPMASGIRAGTDRAPTRVGEDLEIKRPAGSGAPPPPKPPKQGWWERFKERHPGLVKAGKGVAYVGAAAGLGISGLYWFGRKKQQKRETGKPLPPLGGGAGAGGAGAGPRAGGGAPVVGGSAAGGPVASTFDLPAAALRHKAAMNAHMHPSTSSFRPNMFGGLTAGVPNLNILREYLNAPIEPYGSRYQFQRGGMVPNFQDGTRRGTQTR